MSKFLFISVTFFIAYIFEDSYHSYIHRLILGFVDYFIDTIGLSFFTTFNSIHLHKFMRDMVDLKCCP